MTTTGSPIGWVPSACTLPTTEQPLRIAEFDAFFRACVHESQRRGRARLDLTIDAESETSARDLADRESACCSLFEFTFAPAADGRVVMTIAVPSRHVDVLDALAKRVTPHNAAEGRHA